MSFVFAATGYTSSVRVVTYCPVIEQHKLASFPHASYHKAFALSIFNIFKAVDDGEASMQTEERHLGYFDGL